MALSANVARASGAPKTLDVTADVSLGPDPAGGFRITGITLNVSGEVDGLDAAGFREAAEGRQGGLPGQQGAERRRHHLNVT